MDTSSEISRRLVGESEDSETSVVSASLRVDIDATNRLSDILDEQRGKIFETEVLNVASKDVLRRFLSLRSVISTSSSFALQNQDMALQQTGYRRIGFGQCGLIFERPGRNFVLKLARPHFEQALWNDCLSHQRAYQVFTEQSKEPECRVPLLYNYVMKTNTDWWTANLARFSDVSADFPLPTAVLMSERIAPLPRPIRQALIDQFCPQELREQVRENRANRDCLVRIYLGRRRAPDAPPPSNFSLRNYNLCLDQMVTLGLPVELYATAMAEALALMHWSAFMDAYDVEFVLGSEIPVEHTRPMSDCLFWKKQDWKNVPRETDLDSIMRANFRRRPTRIWLLDFNLCSLWTEETVLEFPEAVISQLVLAFFENDPYYPLPLMEPDLDKKLCSGNLTIEPDIYFPGVAAILFMGAMQTYFSYGASMCCGLPSVTLLGQVSDWEDIFKRLDMMEQLGAEPTKFAKMLRPVLRHMIMSFEKPTSPQVVEFWNKIAHKDNLGSGGSYLSGWITAFCFWSEKGEAQQWFPRDPVWGWQETYPEVAFSKIPSGSASVPVLLDDNGAPLQCTMVAGSAAIQATVATQEQIAAVAACDTDTGNTAIQPMSG